MQRLFASKAFITVLFFVIALALYTPVLDAPFKMLDDYSTVVSDPLAQDVSRLGEIYTTSFFHRGSFYRPLVSLSFSVDYQLFGLNSFYYHLTNVVLHASVSILVFVLVQRIAESRMTAFWTALVFAIHPINSEAVGNIADRAVLLSTLFGLSCFVSFLGIERVRHIYAWILSLLFFALALLSKESAVMWPLILAAYLFWLEKPSLAKGAMLRRLVVCTAPYVAVLVVYLLIRQALGIDRVYAERTGARGLLDSLTFLRATLTWLRLFVFPVDLYFDRTQPFFASFGQIEVWVTAGIWMLAIVLIVRLRDRISPLAKFAMAWGVLDLIPVAQIIAPIRVTNELMSAAEHFLYGASVPICLLGVLAIEKLVAVCQARRLVTPLALALALGGVLCYFSVLTLKQNFYARLPAVMFQRTVDYSPRNMRVVNALAAELGNRGYHRDAEYYYRYALLVQPGSTVARIGLGTALYEQGRYRKALAEFQMARDPHRLAASLRQKIVAACDAIIDELDDRIGRGGAGPDAYLELFIVYRQSGRFVESERVLAEAKKLFPNNEQFERLSENPSALDAD